MNEYERAILEDIKFLKQMVEYCDDHIKNLAKEFFPMLPEDFREEKITFWANKRNDYLKQIERNEMILSDMNK